MKNLKTPAGTISWITKRADYLALEAAARDTSAPKSRWVTPFFIIQVRRRDTTDGTAWRIGFTTSRKVGNAVMRNRARRRLRELVRGHLPQLMQPGYDVVIIGRTAAASAPFQLLVTALTDAVQRLNVKA